MNNWIKPAASVLMATAILVGGSYETSHAAGILKEINVVLDDIPLYLGASPVIKNNVTMVPFRSLAAALDIRVSWDGKTKSVIAQGIVNGTSRNVVLKLGQNIATVDGAAVEMLAAPLIVNEQVLIPLSFFGTQFGAKVGWNSATSTVSVVSPKRAIHLRAFYALGSFSQRSRILSMDSTAFGWARINENGELTLDGDDYYWPEAAGDVTAEALIQESAEEGVKPYLMVYAVDGKGELTKMLGDETLRRNSITAIVNLARDKGFGGVLLDYEGLGLRLDALGQQKLLNEYVALLDEELTALNVKLSLAVPPPNGSYKGYDYKKLASYADDLVLMAYDYNPKGTADHTPEPNAKVEEAVQLTLKAGVPADKLILGISLWNETTATVDDKLGLAKRYGLLGASFWRLTFYGDDFAETIDRVVQKVGE
ncbi:stalk domain-containing protein [Cohnella lupini]|uniref:chitinase n=1 Tax=Cohnella lupini TaxID=1294267 RepID=A0A3D9HZ01_9BACL|nr:stalk domain-containing protein [Cohnella lupini]RED54703.1 glycosyl hydrolase family 18 (putative chitinase) [Cohnella lupini]